MSRVPATVSRGDETPGTDATARGPSQPAGGPAPATRGRERRERGGPERAPGQDARAGEHRPKPEGSPPDTARRTNAKPHRAVYDAANSGDASAPGPTHRPGRCVPHRQARTSSQRCTMPDTEAPSEREHHKVPDGRPGSSARVNAEHEPGPGDSAPKKRDLRGSAGLGPGRNLRNSARPAPAAEQEMSGGWNRPRRRSAKRAAHAAVAGCRPSRPSRRPERRCGGTGCGDSRE